jgi:hypothetical protein
MSQLLLARWLGLNVLPLLEQDAMFSSDRANPSGVYCPQGLAVL